ncbi:RHS repeat-associated core domain-containing protein [Pseudomonas helleri]|uniref:RHS repeat-associated core domain-containing protein n=1 Tax=Pseudomonas helleri TaxID=1608996 RepID=UPI003804F271
MSKQRKTVASTYLYDPLDRLATSNSIQRFYNDTRIATEVEGDRKSRFFETDSQPLALQQHGSLPGTTLLATDQQTSVLNGVSPEGALHAQAYSPFGHHPIGASLNGAGFNGERPEPLTGHYLLGQGYRAFNPVLMRFNSPDSWSPFGEGGINAYAYCDNDPLNKVDPTGHIPAFIKYLLRPLKLIKSSKKTTERINDLQRKINTRIKTNKIDTREIASLPENPNTLSRSELLTRALAAQKTADNAVIAANKRAANKGYTKLRRNPFDKNTHFRARGSENNPLPESNSSTQKKMDSSADVKIKELDETARTNYLIAKQYIDKAVNLSPEITTIRTT